MSCVIAGERTICPLAEGNGYVECQQFWFMIIESKRAAFSVEAGLAQILAYMLANPHPQDPCYGLITTSGSFVFLKVAHNGRPRYALSKSFAIRDPDNEFYQVLAILKYLI